MTKLNIKTLYQGFVSDFFINIVTLTLLLANGLEARDLECNILQVSNKKTGYDNQKFTTEETKKSLVKINFLTPNKVKIDFITDRKFFILNYIRTENCCTTYSNGQVFLQELKTYQNIFGITMNIEGQIIKYIYSCK